MSYNITFYCTTGGLGAAQVLDEVLAQARSLETELWAGGRDSGEGWAEADLDLASGNMRSGELRIEVHASPGLVAEMVDQVADSDPTDRVRSADAIIVLTLSGDVDNWGAVKAVWNAVDSRWPVVPYDDVSAFAATKDLLP